MIQSNDMMPLLRNAGPSFNSKWTKLIEYWDDEPPPLYVGLGELVSHLVDLIAQTQVDEFPAVFEVTERMIGEGDEDTRTVAVVGLLEDIQNNCLRRKLNLDVFCLFSALSFVGNGMH